MVYPIPNIILYSICNTVVIHLQFLLLIFFSFQIVYLFDIIDGAVGKVESNWRINFSSTHLLKSSFTEVNVRLLE